MSSEVRGPAAVPPPLIYVAALLVALVLDELWPIRLLPTWWAYLIGTLLVVASSLIIPFVLVRFRRAGTPLNVRKPTTALVTDGPYRFSRNPAYVALTLLYLGVGLLLNNVWALLLVIPALLVLDLWIVRREERHLEERFGELTPAFERQVAERVGASGRCGRFSTAPGLSMCH